MRLFLVILLISNFCEPAHAEDHDLTFSLPSALVVGGGASSTGTKSGLFDVRFMLPRNYWIGAAFNRAIEETDGLETKTSGSAFSIGTDPLEEYSVEGEYDNSGVDDQYRVQEGRVRFTAMPDNFFGLSNSGFEATLELRASKFSFANSPNIIFQSTTVELAAQNARLELAWYGWSPWTIRMWTEKGTLADGFKELARPLAPLFVPLAAISTAVSWTGEEVGAGVAFSRRRWSTRLMGSSRTATVTGEQTGTLSVGGEFRWTPQIATALRFSHTAAMTQSSQTTSTDGDPIQSYGLDLSFLF